MLALLDTLTPPIRKDQRMGELRLQTAEGLIIKTAPLYAIEDVDLTWWEWIKSFFP